MSPLNWSHRCVDIGETPLEDRREASPEECRAVAEMLAIPACKAITARYRLRQRPHGRYFLNGSLEARTEQLCSISLDPMLQDIAVDFQVEFWPEPQLQARQSEAVEFDDFDIEDPEPIVDGNLHVGHLAYELIASHLDPYPRKTGEELEHRSAGEGAAQQNPFAALAALKRDERRS